MVTLDSQQLVNYFIELNTSQYEGKNNLCKMCIAAPHTADIVDTAADISKETDNDNLVRPEEAGIVFVVFCIWIWSCRLFYIRLDAIYVAVRGSLSTIQL